MPPAIIAAGIGAVGAIGGAVLSSSAQKSAANKAAAAQTQATDTQLQLGQQNIAFQQGIYDKNTALLSPFVQRGNAAGGAINSLLGLGGAANNNQSGNGGAPATTYPPMGGVQTASPYTQQPVNAMAQNVPHGSRSPMLGFRGYADNQNDPYQNAMAAPQQAQQPQVAPQASPQSAPQAGQPANAAAGDAFNNFANSAGMQFQLQQGENAINNGYAARGQLQSGAALKALQGYGQSTALNNYFLPYLGLLQGQQATGAQSGAAIAGVGSNFGNTVSNIYGGQQNAIQNNANAQMGAAAASGQAGYDFGKTLGSSLGNFASSFFPSGGSGGGYSPYGSRY